jgi:antitoxin component YwqK of YwqJK toxin-antitoxin module
MKQLLTSCLCFLISSVFGQLQEVYLQMPDQHTHVLPYLSNTIVAYEPTPSDCPFKQEIDSINGEKIVVPNPLFDAKSLTPLFQKNNPYCYLAYPYESSSVDLPPFLDSLNDGIYVQLYDKLPIRDNDTVKWKDSIVAAIFEVKNNRPIGEVSWYYPNGLLMQKGSYTNGLRNGEWFFQFINELSNPSKKKKNWRFDRSSTINYSNGKKNGLEYLITKSWISDKDNGPIEEIWQNYQSDIPHGKYEHRINGKTRTIGTYDNGKPTGKWIQYQWKDSVMYGKLIPRLIYTYSNDSVLVHFPAHLRSQFEHSSFLKSNQILSSDLALMDSYDYYPDIYTDQSIGDNFNALYKVPNCQNLSSGYQYHPLNIHDYLFPMSYCLTDSLGKNHSFESVSDSCGVVFSFSGILEEYYSNGQLKLHFDFDHPETLLNNTVYWENGKPMNQFRKTAAGTDWEQLWYSKKGEIVEHVIYDSLFNFKAKPIDPNYVTLNGKTYSKSGDLLYYTNWKSIPYSKTQPVLITEQRKLKSNHPIEQFYFYPSQRTGFKTLGLDKSYKHVKWFTFDSTFTSAHFIDTVSFGKLFSVVEINDSIRNDLWYQYHHPLKNDTIHCGVIPFGDLSAAITKRTLQYNGKPYTGKLSIHFTNGAKPRISTTKNGLVLSLNRKTDTELLYNLFPQLTSIISANNLSTITDKYIDEEILAVLPEVELKVIEIQFSTGSVNGEVNCFAANSRPLAKLQYEDGLLSGRQVYYNNFPDSYRNFGTYPYRWNDPDQTAENFKHVQLTQQLNYTNGILNGTDLKINLNGDTLSIYNYVNGSLEGEQFAIDDNHDRDFFVYKNDTVLAEKKKDNRTRKTLLEWSTETGIYRSFYKNGQLAQEFIDKNQVYDTIRCYDTLGSLTQKICLADHLLDFVIFYENGERSLTIDFAIEDTLVYPFNEYGLIRYPIAEEVIKDKTIYYSRLYDTQYSGYLKKYNQYNELEEEGMLYRGVKVGDWHYYGSQKSGHYCIQFSDSSDYTNYKERKGNVLFYDGRGKVVSKGELLNYSKEYNCLHRNYNERFAINYELYNTMVPSDTLIHIVHFYKTGVKMNEGFILNGRAQGLWRWYHSDGSLFGLGNYENGQRNGRWLEGDLSQLNFLGEYCLDPDNNNYTNLLKDLAVTVIYYENGKVTDVQNHQFRRTK